MTADEPGQPDRRVIAYLENGGADEPSPGGTAPIGESWAERAELDDLRALLADPSLWAEPRPELEDAVVAAIAAEAAERTAVPDLQPTPVRRPAQGSPIPMPLTTAPETATAQPPSATDLAAYRTARATGWRRVLRPAPLTAIAATVAAVALGAVLIFTGPSQPRFDVALQATELAPGASGSAVLTRTDSGWEIRLDANALPRLDRGQFYQAWLRNEAGVLVPIGSFNEGQDVVLWSGVSPADYPFFTVTREAADGNQASSGQRVLTGTAVPG